jgi:hypothetical protein
VFTRLSAHAEDTEFQGEIYANPDRKLYDNLGMISNLELTTKGEEKRSYLKRGFLNNTLWSIYVRHLPAAWLSHFSSTFRLRSAALLRIRRTLESKEKSRSSVGTLF